MSQPKNLAKSHRVAVTAAGIVSPLGWGLPETLDALREARDCVSPVTSFDVSKCRSSTAGQVPDEWLDRVVMGNRRKRERLHRSSLMMIAAMEETVARDREFKPELMIVGTTSGGMTFGESFYRSLLSNDKLAQRAAWLANYSPQKPVLDAQEAVGQPIPAQIVANACASGSNAIGHAFSLVRHGTHRRVLCGGYDAISELVFVGFDALQASTAERCRPFDRARSGLVLGEGAALLALENWEDAVNRGAPILAEITGYGISTDNHHLTQPHPSGQGPQQAMEHALASAGHTPDTIDYINAHGTATIFNDATEGVAIERVFGRTPVSSTKGMMGHSLGAAGAVEAVISILALQHQFMPANLNFDQADADLDIIANQPRDGTVRCVLSNSFGFGGTNASLILERAA